MYGSVSVGYSRLSDGGLHTNAADDKNKSNVTPKKNLRKKFIVRNVKI